MHLVSEGFEGPHCSFPAMADLLVQVSRVVTDYWGNDFEARRLTVRGRRGRFRGICRSILLLPGYGGSTGAGFGNRLPFWLELLGGNLSTLPQAAMLSAPDALDRLSRRFDAARNNCGPFPQSRKPS